MRLEHRVKAELQSRGVIEAAVRRKRELSGEKEAEAGRLETRIRNEAVALERGWRGRRPASLKKISLEI